MIILTGARGVVGWPLSQRLRAEARPFKAVSRVSTNPPGENLVCWDLHCAMSTEQAIQLTPATTLIHCAPIWLLSARISDFIALGVRRVIVFSSTSVQSKQTSSDASEQALVARLAEAEQTLARVCREAEVKLTIFRPSMIYGYGRDQNVFKIATVIRRFGFMLLVGKATGLRQPVHADDLVDACITALESPQTYDKTYTLAGAEPLSYRSMVERIFKGLGKKPRLYRLPLSVFRGLLWTASKLTRFDYTPEMANRMNQDLVYDFQPATQDFGYQPQAFLSQPQRDLPEVRA